MDHRSAPVPPPPIPSYPGEPRQADPLTLPAFDPVAAPVPHRGRPWVHLVLFLATIASTTLVGAEHYRLFVADYGSPSDGPYVLWRGLWYSATILGILGAHELGHYYACRYYRVDASLPYFLPLPFLFTGTLGAVIRIWQPIRTKPMLFDIGVAGPIAGFVVAVPALFFGLSLSHVVPLPDDFFGLSLGEPPLFRLAAWIIWGTAPEGYSLNLHPVALAAWFGLLITALNLFPIGQLDGGHIAYATFGQRSTLVTMVAAAAVILLTFYSLSWIAWAVVTVFMLLKFGPRHPRTLDHHIPLDRRRMLVAIGALVMFVLCFTP
ncbi:MAG: site-2 protease family protein, partial [Vicinamibacterales bacterium]|nr:site-2 protease family protein [Vicinamibacterales bacterium]